MNDHLNDNFDILPLKPCFKMSRAVEIEIWTHAAGGCSREFLLLKSSISSEVT